MKDLKVILSETKRYYVKASMEHSGNPDMIKAMQSIGICLLFLENSVEEQYVIRDSRNLIYDMTKEIKNKDGKNLLKGLLKIIK